MQREGIITSMPSQPTYPWSYHRLGHVISSASDTGMGGCEWDAVDCGARTIAPLYGSGERYRRVVEIECPVSL